ncbi:peptidase S8/S53 [Tolypothrix tenuis PCC 7101]|uniref:Peptidase S8/S53 n=1 Tax=Tolypothrix tenuis PCC 7101 TaxID=231146 RepID=A0A1Z4N2N1_9CYAN|nr:S8 family peptidase [Aulosira sp. FACHB-113]BAY99881.1 peptidase S8/S53 [Tolypothrix tenuis PCC 7101]BAZ76197.1 peptidase S8/S53 [Aulosira laxa NIES-50]
MSNQYEHLELPVINITLPKRPKRGFGSGGKRDDRPTHGSKLLAQASSLTSLTPKKSTPFGINPKLIFKIKLRKNDSLEENNLSSLGLNLLAKEPKASQAIVVFSSDNELKIFREKLKSYSGLNDSNYEYGYLDAIEDIVPLEPEDRIGRLLELKPLENDEIVPLDLELWHTGNTDEMRDYLRKLDEFLQSFKEYPGMKITDQYISEYFCTARVKLNKKILELLLKEDAVKEIDRRPKPAFESAGEINIPISDLPEVISPLESVCGVLVIDSGIQGGHPLIGVALGDAQVFPDPGRKFIKGEEEDGDETGGHGTGVSGIAVYGDVSACIKKKQFQPPVWLFSARVTNENNEYDPDLLLDKQLEAAINYFIGNYPNCKVINISLGDSNLVYRSGQKQFRLAARIDEIAYKLQNKNIVFVISAGNYYYDSESKELIRRDYPKYLLSEDARIIDPATSAIALTVGSLSMGKGSTQYHEDACRNVVAKVEGYPSPFTRSGFGVDGMIKPDLVDFGGDLVIDGNRMIDNEIGASIITVAKNYQAGSLFKAYCGTSFSAPRVANIVTQLFSKYPNSSSNLIRALITNAAGLPTEIPGLFKIKTKTKAKNKAKSKAKNKENTKLDMNKILQVYGYGHTNFVQAAYSTDNDVVLLVDNEIIEVGNFKIYEIPSLPPEFLDTKGNKKISVTLAFDPPTRHTRGDSYLGVAMEFQLFKNIDIEAITRAFQKAQDENKDNPNEDIAELTMEELKKKYGSSVIVDLQPGVNLRKKGTLQKGQIEFTSKTWKYNQKSMYLVVSCNRKWAREGEIDTQRYALVISVSHSDAKVDLYNKIRLQTQTRISERSRVR